MRTLLFVSLIFMILLLVYPLIAIIVRWILGLLGEVNRIMFILHLRIFNPKFLKELENECDRIEQRSSESKVD